MAEGSNRVHPEDEIEEFRMQCRRQLVRPLADRVRFGFFRNPNPVRDANRNHTFGSMAEYRRFCEQNYPSYYGYGRAGASATEEFRREFEKDR